MANIWKKFAPDNQKFRVSAKLRPLIFNFLGLWRQKTDLTCFVL